jgi:hypothetical protein
MVYVISNHEKQLILDVLGMVSTDFEKLEADEKPEATEDDFVTADKALNVCRRIILEVPITDRIGDIVKDLCVLLHNWNVNVGNFDKLHKAIKFINAAVDQHFTIVTAIEVLKRVMDRAAMITSECDNVNSISAHYLKALDVIHEAKGCGGCDDEQSCGS